MTKNTLTFAAAILILSLPWAASAQVTGTWTGVESGLWTNGSNWSTAPTVPNGPLDKAIFSESGAGRTIDLNASRIVLGGTDNETVLTLGAGGSAYTFNNGTLSFHKPTADANTSQIRIMVEGNTILNTSLDMGNASFTMRNSTGVTFTGTSDRLLTINSPNVTARNHAQFRIDGGTTRGTGLVVDFNTTNTAIGGAGTPQTATWYISGGSTMRLLQDYTGSIQLQGNGTLEAVGNRSMGTLRAIAQGTSTLITGAHLSVATGTFAEFQTQTVEVAAESLTLGNFNHGGGTNGAQSLTFTGSSGGDILVTGTFARANNATGTRNLNLNRPGKTFEFGPTSVTGTGFDGNTTNVQVQAGTLLVNGIITKLSQVTVSNGATLGGSGTLGVTGTINLQSGAKLAPGNSAGVLTIDGNLNLSATVAGANAGSLVFELGDVSSSDRVSLTSGLLSLGTGELEFSDFEFIPLAGFGAGSYTLFSTTTPISGTLGSGVSGTIDGYAATLSFGPDNQSIVLGVIPEPAVAVLIAGLLATVAATLRRRGTNRG